jgi:hypothetical protein
MKRDQGNQKKREGMIKEVVRDKRMMKGAIKDRNNDERSDQG